MDHRNQEISVTNLREQKVAQLKKDFSEKVRLIDTGASSFEFLGVENSHDYPELLKIWANNSSLSKEDKNTLLLKILEHENLHAVPALAKEELGIEVIYGIVFHKNSKPGVASTPDVKIICPDQINLLTPEGEKIAMTVFEVALNPVLNGVEQKFSDQDISQIVKYLTIFKAAKGLYTSLLTLLKKLPENEQLKILNLID